MNIVIVGSGRVGAALAETFDRAGHRVVILDISTRASGISTRATGISTRATGISTRATDISTRAMLISNVRCISFPS